jgi:hypothetical protein
MDANQVHVDAGNTATTNRALDKVELFRKPLLLNLTIGLMLTLVLVIAFIYIPHNLFTGLVCGFGLMWAGKKIIAGYFGKVLYGIGVITILATLWGSGPRYLVEKAVLSANETAMSIATGESDTVSQGKSWFKQSHDSDIVRLDMNKVKPGDTVTVTHRLDVVVVIVKKPNRDLVKTYWVCGKVKNKGYQTPEGLVYDYDVINNVYEISHLRLSPKAQEELRERGVTLVTSAFKDGWEPC